LAALLGLVLVLLALVGMSWLGFRFVRRYMTAWDAEATPPVARGPAHLPSESVWRDDSGENREPGETDDPHRK
jgi:hypothetical protein